MPAQSVDDLVSLAHQQISGFEYHGRGLLLLTFDRDKAHGRPLSGLANGLGVGRIVLLPFNEWLHIVWGDQSHPMTQGADLASPVMGAGTGFHGDRAGRLSGKKRKQLASR